MPTYTSYDVTELAYRVEGEGEPLVVWPGGPARDPACLGTHDSHGTLGGLADDLEALRRHLGLETFGLLGHSAGGFVTQLYAAEHARNPAGDVAVPLRRLDAGRPRSRRVGRGPAERGGHGGLLSRPARRRPGALRGARHEGTG